MSHRRDPRVMGRARWATPWLVRRPSPASGLSRVDVDVAVVPPCAVGGPSRDAGDITEDADDPLVDGQVGRAIPGHGGYVALVVPMLPWLSFDVSEGLREHCPQHLPRPSRAGGDEPVVEYPDGLLGCALLLWRAHASSSPWEEPNMATALTTRPARRRGSPRCRGRRASCG